MQSKYFTVDIVPTLVASEMAAAAYTDGDVIFKSTSFEVPRGACRLMSVQMMYRGIDGVAQDGDIHLVFTKSELTTAAGNAANDLNPSDLYSTASPSTSARIPEILGSATILNGSAVKCGTFTVASLGPGVDNRMAGPVLSIDPSIANGGTRGTNIGYDKYFVHGTCGGNVLDFRSTLQVSTETATNTTAVVVKTTSALTTCAPGDVLKDEADQAIGTIASITDANNIVLAENCASVSAVNQDLYVLNPIELRLTFER